MPLDESDVAEEEIGTHELLYTDEPLAAASFADVVSLFMVQSGRSAVEVLNGLDPGSGFSKFSLDEKLVRLGRPLGPDGPAETTFFVPHEIAEQEFRSWAHGGWRPHISHVLHPDPFDRQWPDNKNDRVGFLHAFSSAMRIVASFRRKDTGIIIKSVFSDLSPEAVLEVKWTPLTMAVAKPGADLAAFSTFSCSAPAFTTGSVHTKVVQRQVAA